MSTIERPADETFQHVMQRLGIPTRKDSEHLTRRNQRLTAASSAKPRPRRPAARKATPVAMDAD
jgi:hypothetical protein